MSARGREAPFCTRVRGQGQGACISFETSALLFRVLSGKRWELLATMTGAGPITIREAARRAGRDIKAVHGHVRALLHAGILRKTETGKVEFPFYAVHVDFKLQAAERAQAGRGAHIQTAVEPGSLDIAHRFAT